MWKKKHLCITECSHDAICCSEYITSMLCQIIYLLARADLAQCLSQFITQPVKAQICNTLLKHCLMNRPTFDAVRHSVGLLGNMQLLLLYTLISYSSMRELQQVVSKEVGSRCTNGSCTFPNIGPQLCFVVTIYC